MALIAVIDLGEIPAGPVLDDPPIRPRPRRRWVVAALTLATALSTVAADDPSPRPLPAVVVDVPGDVRVLVDRDRLFVVQPFALSQGREGGRYVVAYRLMDLRQIWRVGLPLGGDVFGLTVFDGALALTGEPSDGPVNQGAGATDNAVGPDTVGLNPATGAVLWRHKGFVEGTTPGGRLILSTEVGNPGAIPASSWPGRTMRAITGTGQVVWSYDPPVGALRSYRFDGEVVTLLAVVLPDGRVELRDTDTGRLVRSGQVGPLEYGADGGPYVEIVGDLLLLREGAEVLAYGLDRLDLRWRLPVQAQGGWFTVCGAAICVVHDRTGLDVVDPATGRLRWSDQRWTQGFAFDGRLMVTDFDPQRAQQTVAVVDPYTGRVERQLGRWDALDIGGSILALRFDFTRVLVARLDPARGAQVVGVVPEVVGASCQMRLPYLWCRRTDNTLGIWRLPG